jgi:hypothetical protein
VLILVASLLQERSTRWSIAGKPAAHTGRKGEGGGGEGKGGRERGLSLSPPASLSFSSFLLFSFRSFQPLKSAYGKEGLEGKIQRVGRDGRGTGSGGGMDREGGSDEVKRVEVRDGRGSRAGGANQRLGMVYADSKACCLC